MIPFGNPRFGGYPAEQGDPRSPLPQWLVFVRVSCRGAPAPALMERKVCSELCWSALLRQKGLLLESLSWADGPQDRGEGVLPRVGDHLSRAQAGQFESALFRLLRK